MDALNQTQSVLPLGGINPMQQPWEYWPALRPLYPFKYENEYNAIPWVEWADSHPNMLFIVIFEYLGIIGIGQWLMRNREPIKATKALALWNGFFSLFSLCGALRTWPYIMMKWHQAGYRATVCGQFQDGIIYGPTGLWGVLFVWSKFFEFGDTIFLILRKKHIRVLHWYHHLTVWILVWQGSRSHSAVGFYAVALNFSVHVLMYHYYHQQALGIKPTFRPRVLTLIQIVQMVAGTAVGLSTSYYSLIGPDAATCRASYKQVNRLVPIIVSYFFAFVHYYYQRYVCPSRKCPQKSAPKKKKANKRL